MKSNKTLLALFFSVLLTTCAGSAFGKPLAIVGATLVDVANDGRTTDDIWPATVILDHDRIVYAGPSASASLPPDADIIDARG